MTTPTRAPRARLSTLISTLALVLAAGLLTAVVSSPAQAATPPAPTERSRVNYGSIAIAVDGTFAVALDRRTKSRAIKDAYAKCKNKSDFPGTCRKIVWFRNSCAAIAYRATSEGYISKYNWGFGRTRPAAIKAAKRRLSGPDKVLGWACTTRYR